MVWKERKLGESLTKAWNEIVLNQIVLNVDFVACWKGMYMYASVCILWGNSVLVLLCAYMLICWRSGDLGTLIAGECR